jgi:MYXO-CTERM domain-containing protein
MKSTVIALAVAFVLALFSMPASANPGVPYCLGSAAVAPGLAPPVVQPEVCEAATGRVFPEAIERPEYVSAGGHGFASDFVSFPEFEAGLNYLAQKYSDKVTVHRVAESYGLPKTPGGPRDRFPVYIAEITNKKSPVPMGDRLEVLFMLSIHGNEKGGREGGFRVLEDLATGKGIAQEVVQNGAGMPSPLAKPGGGEVRTYGDYLDFMRIYLLWPNPDGWMHDELPYAVSDAQLCGTLFCRTNGNGTDLNRQMPTIGWQLQNPGSGRIAVNEPEAKGYLQWLVDGHHWNYAIDIHGMLNHQNFIAIMMPAGSFSPQEMQRSTRLAETLKERLNNDDHFSAWTTLLGAAQQAGAPAGSPSTAVGSGEFSDWSTVWDAIGYTDSGFSGDFFAQSSGLNAPGYDIEMAYNHITFDSQYEAGALFNDYHVHTVRHIVKSFMDAAALDVQVSYETGGKRTLVLEPQYVATNLDDKDEKGIARPTPGGWADSNPGDDHWQYSAASPIQARPAKYWSDLAPFLKDGDKPGVLHLTTANRLTPELLKQYDALVIPGSAINQFVSGDAKSNTVATGAPDAARLQMVLDWVKAGGNLVLTDSALKFFDLSGLSKDAVQPTLGYAGAINLDRSHPLAKDVRGEARQTYEPVPLGFAVGDNSPIWGIQADAFKGLGGDAAGTGYRGTDVSLGRLQLDAGQIQFIGALLPDPTEEFYHPYGLDDYATTYSGNQMLRNMLGWGTVFTSPPVVITGEGQVRQSANEPPGAATPEQVGAAKEAAKGKGTPGPAGAELLLVLGLALAFAVRRRKSP